jgi:hypothetical protein
MDNIDPNGRPGKIPRAKGNFKLRLRTPGGVILAYCPSHIAGLKTARSIFDRIEIVELKSGAWQLWSDGILSAIIGK